MTNSKKKYNSSLHKGEILKAIVQKYEGNVSALAKKMEYDRSTIYRHFQTDDLSDGIILEYAKAMKYDFSNEFPDIYNKFREPEFPYQTKSYKELEEDRDYWKEKYYKLLETNNDLLNKLYNPDKDK